MNDVIKLLKYESNEMNEEFNKASIKGNGTPQEISDFREGYFQDFIKKYFPYPYRVTKGGIIDIYNKKSDSIDCILLNPCHPYTIDSGNKFSIILADGVECAIEIKPNISKRKELEIALVQIKSVKQLKRTNSPIILKSNERQEYIDYSKQIPTIIFATKANKDIEKTINNIIQYYKKENIPIEEQFDYIVINGRGIIANYKVEEQIPYEQKICGYYYEEWEELTLAAMLLYINISLPPMPQLTKGNAMGNYLAYNIKPKRWGYISYSDVEKM